MGLLRGIALDCVGEQFSKQFSEQFFRNTPTEHTEINQQIKFAILPIVT